MASQKHPELPLDEVAAAFAAYGKPVRTWSEARKREMRARLKEAGGDPAVLASAVHGYAYFHRGSTDEQFDPLRYLTPDTVFRPSKFAKYLDAAHEAADLGLVPPFDLSPPPGSGNRGKGMEVMRNMLDGLEKNPWKH